MPHIIACFDDTGLEAARCAAKAPVIGIGEAGFHLASLIAAALRGGDDALASPSGRSRHNLLKYGLAERCARVRACRGAGACARGPRNADASAKICAEITAAIREDRAEAIVLGCAGMADLAAELADTHGLPVVDGVAGAVKLAEGAGAARPEDIPARPLRGAACRKPIPGRLRRFSPDLSS